MDKYTNNYNCSVKNLNVFRGKASDKWNKGCTDVCT